MNHALLRALSLLFIVLLLAGCATGREWAKHYLPPLGVNDIPFDSAITAQPEQIQFVHGEGFESFLLDELRNYDIHYTVYFNPEDKSPFAPPARVTSVQYLYCMFGDEPGLCGGLVIYESEEAGERRGVLAKIKRTNHELIMKELVERHRRPQYVEKYTQTLIEEADAVYRSPIDPRQRRVWCDYAKGQPKFCERSIIAIFSARKGRGYILYFNSRAYRYARRFADEVKHDHPVMETITDKAKFLTQKEVEWWEGKGDKHARWPDNIPQERFRTEIQLEERARAANKPRIQIERVLSRNERADAWIRSYTNGHLESATKLKRDYWFGYWEGTVARDFNHQFNLTTEAHDKWLAALKGQNIDLIYAARGYADGLAGVAKPPLIFDVCQEANLGLWQQLKCIVNGR